MSIESRPSPSRRRSVGRRSVGSRVQRYRRAGPTSRSVRLSPSSGRLQRHCDARAGERRYPTGRRRLHDLFVLRRAGDARTTGTAGASDRLGVERREPQPGVRPKRRASTKERFSRAVARRAAGPVRRSRPGVDVESEEARKVEGADPRSRRSRHLRLAEDRAAVVIRARIQLPALMFARRVARLSSQVTWPPSSASGAGRRGVRIGTMKVPACDLNISQARWPAMPLPPSRS